MKTPLLALAFALGIGLIGPVAVDAVSGKLHHVKNQCPPYLDLENATERKPLTDDCPKPDFWKPDETDTGCYGFIADYTCKKFPDPPAKVNASVAFNPENRKLDLHVHWCPPEKRNTWGFQITVRIHRSPMERYLELCSRTYVKNKLSHTFSGIDQFGGNFDVRIRSLPYGDDIEKSETKFKLQAKAQIPITPGLQATVKSQATSTTHTTRGYLTPVGKENDNENEPEILTIILWAVAAIGAIFVIGVVIWKLKNRRQPGPRRKHITKDESSSAPIALLLCCRGCEVVEGFTVNLTHILRYHGVNAISDLFEENEIREKGISVYLESKLRQADTVILVCTEEINGYRLPSHTPFFSVLKIINHKIVSEEEPPGKYIPIYFQDRDKVVPLWLHPKAIDFNTNLLKERIKMILHIVLHISDLDKICFDSSSIEALNDLGNCAVRILYDGHEECYREHCLKGRKSPSQATFYTSSKGSHLTHSGKSYEQVCLQSYLSPGGKSVEQVCLPRKFSNSNPSGSVERVCLPAYLSSSSNSSGNLNKYGNRVSKKSMCYVIV